MKQPQKRLTTKPDALRDGKRKVQAWLPAEDVRALKLRAAEQDRTLQDLIGEAVGAMLRASQGRA